MMKIVFLFLAFTLLGSGSCQSIRLDPERAMAAMDGGDSSVIIEGCGSQPVSGYTYCRVTEGDNTNQKILLHLPSSKCLNEPCVTYKVFFPSSEPSIGGSLENGKTVVEIKWSDLTKKSEFTTFDRGFWPVLIEVKWIDKDGFERTSFAEGEIRLRVLKKQYTSLHTIKDDNNFVWVWSNGGREFKYTTGLRSYTGAFK